jgi:hypothetical protein
MIRSFPQKTASTLEPRSLQKKAGLERTKFDELILRQFGDERCGNRILELHGIEF